MGRTYWVYIMTNRSGTLYTGLTGDLARRVHEHRHRLVPGFTSRYRIDRLIYAESHTDVRDAIVREKQIKGWSRAKKLSLISTTNPDWRDLGTEWFAPAEARRPWVSKTSRNHAKPCHPDEGGISAEEVKIREEKTKFLASSECQGDRHG